MDLVSEITFFFMDVKDYILFQLHERTVVNWVLFFFPLVILVEVPRYFLPAIILPLLHFMGFKEHNKKAQREFLKTEPFVSVIVAGRNEGEIIGSTIDSLLNLTWRKMEIIVVDDASTDNMYDICKRYADKGLIRLFRNTAKSGRAGRPVASNLGLRMSRGQFIISVDADTSYDYDIVEHMIGPFYDPKVGVVAGNLKARNIGASIWADFQAIEYLISIGLWKRWTSVLNTTLQASGAFGAFRREALLDFGGWDPELAEDADLSLKARKNEWDIAFAPEAIAMTNVPETLKTLVNQRIRWDKGTIRTYFHKHGDIMMFWRFRLRNFIELAQEYMMVYVFSFIYIVYLVFMIFFDVKLLCFALFAAYAIYIVMTFFTLLATISFSERRKSEWCLLWYAPFFPFYKEIFRWVRLYANILETFRWGYEESYLPKSGYKHTERW